MFSKFNYKYLYIFIIFFSIIEIITNNENIVILNQYEYELNISKYNLTVLNLNKEIYNMKYSLMAYINDSNINKEKIFSDYTPYYNHFWLFFITDIKIFNQMISRYKCINDYMIIYGIIIPKSLTTKLPKYFNTISPPIFYIDDSYINNMKESDFRNNDKILYFSFDTEMPISRYPELYFLISSSFLFCISCFIYYFGTFYTESPNPNI